MRNLVLRLAAIAAVVLTTSACADSPTQSDQQRAPDLAAVRVDAYMRAQREGEREHLMRNRLYRPGGVVLRAPTPEVYAEVEAQFTETAADWNALVERTAEWVRRSRQARRQGMSRPLGRGRRAKNSFGTSRFYKGFGLLGDSSGDSV